MKLKYIYQQLSIGEFSQINFGDGPGVIGEKSYENIMAHLNLGMSALYKRFKIKEGFVNVQLMPNVYTYTLDSKHSVTKTANPSIPKYLLDTKTSPFGDNVNKIERILSASTGGEFPLNRFNDPMSINLTTMNSFTVPPVIVDSQNKLPDYLKGDVLTVYYRVGHTPMLDKTLFVSPEITEVDIPDIYLEALLYYIASRVHNPIGFTKEFHEGNNYAAKYEAECYRLEQAGLQLNDLQESDRFYRNGWV